MSTDGNVGSIGGPGGGGGGGSVGNGDRVDSVTCKCPLPLDDCVVGMYSLRRLDTFTEFTCGFGVILGLVETS